MPTHSNHVANENQLGSGALRPPAESGVDPVGRFHVARQRGGKPVALSAWRITTGDRTVAESVARVYGGVLQPLGADDGHGLEVLTSRHRVSILLGAESISLRLVMRGIREAFHVCDGTRFLEPETARGGLCGCSPNLAHCKAAAKSGRGPTPEATLRFRLADMAELGMFSLVSTSWKFFEELSVLAASLDGVDEAVVCRLLCEQVEFSTRSGLDVSYRRPVVEVVAGSAVRQ